MQFGQKIFSLLKALLAAYVITALLLVLTAFVMYKLAIGENTVNLIIIIIYVLSSFAGGMLAGKMVKEKKYIWGLAIGALYVLVIAAVSFVLNGTISFSAVSSVTTIVLCLAGGMLGGMLG